MAAAWASIADVAELTGVTVTDAQLLQAQSQVELRVGRTYAAGTNIGARDLRWLKKAVAYQVVWMLDQADLLTRSDTNGAVIQDGQHIEVTKEGLTLAPLARVALKRLTWRGNRSVRTESTLAMVRGTGNPAALSVGAVYDYPGDRWHREV
jgi:hypothetical protein